MEKKTIQKIKTLLKSPKKIVIITHANPDGDALGSILALYGIFKKLNHDITLITPDAYPSFLAWMPFSKKICIYNKTPEKVIKKINDAELIFCLDFNSSKRMDKVEPFFLQSKATKILIDHHLKPALFTDYTISITNTSSTAEIIYDFILACGYKKLLDKQIAASIYVGIITDTGSFSYSCNHPKTYIIISELMKLGIDGAKIHQLIYDTYSESRMRLLGYCLSEKLKVIPKYNTAYISLSKKDLLKYNHQLGDTEGIVNFALSIENVKMAALFVEKEENIKISLRSVGNIAVNEIAKKYYSGGGHKNASGGSSYVNMNETLSFFENNLSLFLSENKK